MNLQRKQLLPVAIADEHEGAAVPGGEDFRQQQILVNALENVPGGCRIIGINNFFLLILVFTNV